MGILIAGASSRIYGVAFPGGGGGADPYIPRDPTGTDKYINPSAASDGTGTQASPWKTWSQSRFQSLTEGQQLVIMGAGTIDMVDSRGLASGSSANRIVVRPYPGNSPTLNFPTGGIMMGGGDYWDWYGLNVTCNDTGWKLQGSNPDSGAGAPINNWRFIDLVATKGTTGSTDNSGVIYLGSSGVDYISVIRGSYTGPGNEAGNNRSGLFVDAVPRFEAIGAYLTGFNIPIYYKHNHQRAQNQVAILFKNLIVSGQNRGMLQCVAYAQYLNCAFDSVDLDFSDDGGNPAGDYNSLSHCTFLKAILKMNPPQVPATTDLQIGAYGNTLRNLLFATGGAVWDNSHGANSNMDQQTDTDYNGFTSGSSVYSRNNSSYSLSGYKSAFSTREVHSTAGTQTLVGGTTPGNTPANWALQAGSAGKAAANDGTDQGVDATKLLTVN